ncbi:MAG TPA: SBBP repeat-containing protein, partial [bacterium]
TGTGLVYSTYLGGSVDDVGKGISLDSSGNAYVTGYTNGNFPATSGAYQTAYGGSGDSFVTKFDVTAFYTPTPCGLPGNTCTPTQTGTPSYTPTKTYTYTPTYTYTLTLTPMVTPTPTNTLPPGTNTYTPGVTNTFTPTYTYTPSYTSTQTYTFTITFTNTITSTPVVTATYTPGYLGPNPPTPGTSFVYPSPATGGTVNIAYDMQESGTAQVSVWNASAELVTDVNQTQWVGPQKTTLNTQGWARGVYFYRVILHYNSGKLEKLPPDKFYVE